MALFEVHRWQRAPGSVFIYIYIMYIYIYVLIYIYTYVCMHSNTSAHTYIYLYVWMYGFRVSPLAESAGECGVGGIYLYAL